MFTKNKFLLIFFLFLFVKNQLVKCQSNKVVFQFPEFDYKETSKNVIKSFYKQNVLIFKLFFNFQDLTFREFESACDQSSRCLSLVGIFRQRCVRECVSPSCYKEIYRFDEVT